MTEPRVQGTGSGALSPPQLMTLYPFFDPAKADAGIFEAGARDA
jgi:hypothetical protein